MQLAEKVLTEPFDSLTQEPDLVIESGIAIRSRLPRGFTGNLYIHPTPEAVRKLPRLTDDELFDISVGLRMGSSAELRKYAHAVMDKMEAKAKLDSAKGE